MENLPIRACVCNGEYLSNEQNWKNVAFKTLLDLMEKY